jgi:hypothetical protein
MTFFRRHYKKLLVVVLLFAVFYTVQGTRLVRWYSATISAPLSGNCTLAQTPVDSLLFAGRKESTTIIPLEQALAAGDGLFILAPDEWAYDTLIPGKVVVHVSATPSGSGSMFPLFNSFGLNCCSSSHAECIVTAGDGQMAFLTFNSTGCSQGSASATGIVTAEEFLPGMAQRLKDAQWSWMLAQVKSTLQQLAADPSRFGQPYITTGHFSSAFSGVQSGTGFGG